MVVRLGVGVGSANAEALLTGCAVQIDTPKNAAANIPAINLRIIRFSLRLLCIVLPLKRIIAELDNLAL